jgi:hypothetical protein
MGRERDRTPGEVLLAHRRRPQAAWSPRPPTGPALRGHQPDCAGGLIMRWLHKLLMRGQMLFLRNRAGDQLQDELQFHLDQQIAENIAAGMEPRGGASRRAASVWQSDRAARSGARDLELAVARTAAARSADYGVRTLARTPGFTVIAILVMGLGIGANVALFTVVRSVLLKPLPFKRSGPSGPHLRGRCQRPLSGQHRCRRHLRLLAIAVAQLRADGHQAVDALRPRRRRGPIP